MEDKITNVEELYNFMHMLADIGCITEEEHDSAINVVSELAKYAEICKTLREYRMV